MSELQYIEVAKIHPHPGNPRKDLGDLSELADSIKANGVLQNLTVVPLVMVDPDATVKLGNDHYTVVIGHRRLAAAAIAGLDKVPCVVMGMDEATQLRTMLMENMQRADLTVCEQAQGFQMMLDLGDTVEDITQQSGFSKKTVRQRLKIMELDQEILKEVSGRQLSIADFDKLAEIEDINVRNKCLEDIGTSDFERNVAWELRKQAENKNRPLAEQFLKGIKAKEISSSEAWGAKYQRLNTYYLNEWDPDKVVLPEDKTKRIYFNMQGSYVELYIDREKAPREKKSEEEKARDRVIRTARKELKGLAIKTYTARAAFVDGLSVGKSNEAAVFNGALVALALISANYTSGKEKMWEYVGIKDRSYKPGETGMFIETVAGLDKKKLPGFIYAAMGDSEEACNFSDYAGAYPSYRQSDKLRAIYAWLTSLGYEMSDEEKALQDGSHPLYQAPDKKEAS